MRRHKTTGERQLRRHSKYKNRAKNGRRGPCDGTPVWPHLEALRAIRAVQRLAARQPEWRATSGQEDRTLASKSSSILQRERSCILPAQIRGIANARRLLNFCITCPAQPFCRHSITFLANESQERSRGLAGKLRSRRFSGSNSLGGEGYARPLNFFLISS